MSFPFTNLAPDVSLPPVPRVELEQPLLVHREVPSHVHAGSPVGPWPPAGSRSAACLGLGPAV